MNLAEFKPSYVFSYFGSAAEHSVTNLHNHDCWQLDTIISGKARIRYGTTEKVADNGNTVLIYPGILHQFTYLDKKTRYVSLRFDLNGFHFCDSVAWLPDCPSTRAVINAICTLLSVDRNLSEAEKRLLEHFLDAFLIVYLDSRKGLTSFHTQTIAEQAMEYIDKNAFHALTVAEVADHLNYSASHVSAQFSKFKGMPIKNYIDEKRIEIIQQYLLYSDLNISEIAYTLGFIDIYTFSRFFKRHTSVSPRTYRIQRGSQITGASADSNKRCTPFLCDGVD